MTLSCKLWSSEDAWERDKNNAVYKKYTVWKVLIKKWTWFLEVERDENATKRWLLFTLNMLGISAWEQLWRY
jgi:hypothetical protein